MPSGGRLVRELELGALLLFSSIIITVSIQKRLSNNTHGVFLEEKHE